MKVFVLVHELFADKSCCDAQYCCTCHDGSCLANTSIAGA
jgi:hypothetical protein